MLDNLLPYNSIHGEVEDDKRVPENEPERQKVVPRRHLRADAREGEDEEFNVEGDIIFYSV